MDILIDNINIVNRSVYTLNLIVNFTIMSILIEWQIDFILDEL